MSRYKIMSDPDRIIEAPEGEMEVFLCIARKGPISKYDIKKDTGLSYSTVFEAVEKNIKDRVIRIVTRKRSRVRKLINLYDLTPWGLLLVLKINDKRVTISSLAERYREFLPHIFSKWKYFIENNIEDLAKRRLLETVFWYLANVNPEIREDPEKIEKEITPYFILPKRGEFVGDEVTKWYNVLSKDNELFSLAVKYAKEMEILHLNNAKDWKDVQKDLRVVRSKLR